MVDLNGIDRIYLYPGAVDLRKGMNTLGYMASRINKEDGLHKLFLFCNRRTNLLKIYEKDQAGVWVYVRRLDDSNFGWPKNVDEAMGISKAELTWLLSGLRLIKGPKDSRYLDKY